jgi:hypothetical protein
MRSVPCTTIWGISTRQCKLTKRVTYWKLLTGENSEYIKQSIECSRNARQTREAYARCQYHLAILYQEQGVSEKDSEYLKSEARKVIEECRQFAAECLHDVKDAKDETMMMILDDLQGTFQGRYTGRALLPFLQACAKREKEKMET